MKKQLLKLCLMSVMLIGLHKASAQDVFLQGTYMEVGVSPGGSLGTNNNAPPNFNAVGQLGFVADVDKDGWNNGTPAYCGDYFMPGSPEEGWGIEWTTSGTEYTFNNVYLEGEDEVTLQSHLDKSYGDYRVSEWIGEATNGAEALRVKQVLQFHKDSLQFSFTITLKNTGSTILESLEYMRNLDPDQEEPITGNYTTRNYVAHQPGTLGNPDTAMVVAEALLFSKYKIIIASINNKAVVSTEGFDNRDPDEILDSPNAPSKSSPEEEDQAIVIAYRFGDLAPGDSVVFTYFYILKEEQIAVVTPNAINVSAISPASFCPTAATSVTVPFATTGSFNAGNIFTAQLSDANGSFASPTTIGTLTGTSSGVINATIPAGTATGQGYRIRVVSSNPVVTGNDNGTNIPGGAFVSATNSFSCAAAAVTLNASASSGTIEWYNIPSGGSSIATGASYTTPLLSSTTPYYVQAVYGSCTSTRILVQAIISSGPPTIASYSDGSRCGNGKVTLSATASSGLVKWYDDPSAGSLIYTGSVLETSSISAGNTLTYYAEADNGCVSAVRTAVVATAYEYPYVDGTSNTSRCFEGPLSMEVTPIPSSATVTWYDAQFGGNLLYTGTTYDTPSLTDNAVYYVSVSGNGCTSLNREYIEAVIVSPEIVNVTNGDNCGMGTINLSVTYNGTEAYWYDVATGGTSLANSSNFTTPTLSVSTDYYVEVEEDGCYTPRVPVRAVISSQTPQITGNTPGTVCSISDNATISVITSEEAIIKWYDDENMSNLLFTGDNFTVSNISGDTSFYAEASNACGSSSPTAVNVIFTSCTGVKEPTNTAGLSIYPNPNQGTFEILSGKITEGTIELTDHTGRILLSQTFSNGKAIVEKSELANGFYFVRLKNEYRSEVQKIVVTK